MSAANTPTDPLAGLPAEARDRARQAIADLPAGWLPGAWQRRAIPGGNLYVVDMLCPSGAVAAQFGVICTNTPGPSEFKPGDNKHLSSGN